VVKWLLRLCGTHLFFSLEGQGAVERKNDASSELFQTHMRLLTLSALQFTIVGVCITESASAHSSLESIQQQQKGLPLQSLLKQKPLPSLNKTRKDDNMAKKQVATDRDADAAVASRGGGVSSTEETYSPLVTLRRTIFPIYGQQEVTKFLLIGTIKFFIIMALTLTRDTKDTLVVTQCGAEAIAFLKVCYAGTCTLTLHVSRSNIRPRPLFPHCCWPPSRFTVSYQLQPRILRFIQKCRMQWTSKCYFT
jgi:TLC ATP/ADP transporter